MIAEDLSASEAGDFDFNDVVFDVVKAENGKTTLKLICAGGVLPLRVRGANEAEGQEIHGLFGEATPNEKGKYKMYNTGAGPDKDPVEFTVEGEYTTPEQIQNIIIEVFKENNWMELKAEKVWLHVRSWWTTASPSFRNVTASPTSLVISPLTFKVIGKEMMTSGGSRNKNEGSFPHTSGAAAMSLPIMFGDVFCI